MNDFGVLDYLALGGFLLAWTGYAAYADRSGKSSLIRVVDDYRLAWMQRMLLRENRIGDTAIIGNIMRSIGFFASTTIFLLAGLIALLGAAGEVVAIVRELPLAVPTTPFVIHVKVLALIAASAWVVLVMYRREMRSRTLRDLEIT